AGFEKTVYVWEASTGKLRHRLQSGSDYIGAVAFSPDGRSLVAGDRKCIQVWELATGKERAKFKGGLDSGGRSLVFTPDGKTVIGPCTEQISKGSWRSTLRQWDAVTGDAIRDLPGSSCNCVAFSPDGKLLAVGNGQDIRLFDMPAGKEVRTWLA